ncbi:MAG TPA: monovalent cation:proton antiporter family protein [Candidatus Binatia bacterium]|nr:monovalent cation:proton antiporter family protein [Candidatus Binatia bacterium]
MENHDAFQSLLLLTVLAAVVPILIRQVQRILPVPIVVGEIVAGIAVGRNGLNLVHESPVLSFLADFGFIFLMFLSGLEVNLNAFAEARAGAARRPLWQRPVWLAGANFGLTLFLGLLTGLALWRWNMTSNPILMGLILSTTSMGIVMPVLKERELTGKPYGQIMLLSALFSDFLTLLFLGLMISVVRKGQGADLAFFILLLAAFVGAAKLGRWAQSYKWTHRLIEELSHATAQIRVRGAFALIVLWVVLAESLGVEVILGAFLAGALIGQNRQTTRQIFEEKLDAMGYGFFIPIFFIMVGARFDLTALLNSPGALWLVGLLIVAAYLVKLLPALCFRPLFSWRESLAAGVLLSSRLSLIIAASAIALSLNMITPAVNAAVVLVAIVTCTASPILFNRLLPMHREKKRSGVIILGTDFLAELLGKRLQQEEPVTFIGRDVLRLEKLREAGSAVVSGPPDDEQVLRRAGAEQARAMVALSNDPAVVTNACRQAREVFQIPSIVARADEQEQVRSLQALGVQVVQPTMAMALGLEGALNYPSAFSALIDQSDQFDFADAPLRNPVLLDRPLRELHLSGKALVLGIRRRGEGEVVVPHGDTTLREGDVLMLCGAPEATEEARRWIAGERAIPPGNNS